MIKKLLFIKFNILIFLLLAFSVKTSGQTSTSGGAYIWSTATSWTPSSVPTSSTNVSVNNPLTLDQNLIISTGDYSFNQDVTDQPGGSDYNLTNLDASGSLTIASGTTTIGGITNIGGNATFTLTVKSGATLILGTPGSTSNNFLIGNKVVVKIESGAAIIVYGNIVNSNSSGTFTVNGLLQVYGDYKTDNGNIDISGSTGQFYTTGGMNTQGNSSEIYGSSNNCTSNCSGTSLGCGASNSDIAYTAIIAPQSQTVCSGGAITTMTFTTNAPSPTYQWEYSLSAGGSYTSISGENANSYTPSSLTVTRWYRVKYTSSNCSGNKYSAPIPVYVSASTYTQSTVGQTLCGGAFGPISVSALGTGLIYQWYSNTTASNSGGSLISGATSNVYTPSSTIGGVKYYYCIINSSCGVPINTAVSGAFTVNLNSAGLASSSPTPCINTLMTSITHTTTGATGIGTATNLPAGVSAAWSSNTITISGTPTASGIFNYTIPLTGGCGIVSATGTITVNALPNNTSSSGFTGGSFCIGSQATVTFDAEDANGVPPYTLSYTDGTTIYSQTIDSNAATAFNVSATSSTRYTLKSITNFNGCVNFSPANTSADVTFRPNPSATISGTTAVCLGDISPNIAFTNPQSAGITVTYTINGGANQTVSVPAKSTENVPVTTSIAGSFMYTLVSVAYSTNPSCIQTITGSATVVVNSFPSAPTVTLTQPTCKLATGSLSITAVSGETYSFDGNTYSGTLVYSGLSQGSSHTVYAKNASGCISTSVGVTIMPLVTNTYSGTWSAGSAPPATNGTQNIVFNAGYTATTDLSGCSCQVNSGAVVIKSGQTLSLDNELTVSGGSLKFENNASLIQTNTGTISNTGNITYERITPTAIDNFDYTYWSSPVSPQKLIDVSPNTSLDKFYSFNLTVNDWQQENPNINMIPGVGYIIRGPQTYAAPAPPNLYQASFKGVPNNGVFSVAIPTTPIGSEASALLGNPYPSALDADLFLKANMATALEGTLYFWTHNTNIGAGTANLGSGAYAYTSNDYATYNLTGGAATEATGVNNSIPNGKIASGQAFFAGVNPEGGTVTFNNSMRLSSTGTVLDNSQFFKLSDAKSKASSSIEKDRVWLNLFNSQGAFKQTLVGYIIGATDEYDNGYDGETFDGNEFVDFYSINQDKNLVIQGRALPFDETDEVPLGYKTTVAGDFTIAIAQTDGFLATQEIFLEDKINKSIRNLKVGHYTFTTGAGTFNNRFVLRFINANKILGTSNFERLNNSVLVSNKNKQIKINSSIEMINNIQIYDLLGRSIYQKMNINTSEFLISNLVSNHEVLLVKIKLQSGQTVSKKIVY